MTHRHVTYLRRAEYDVTCDRSIPNWGTHRQHIQYIQGREGGPTKSRERGRGHEHSRDTTQARRTPETTMRRGCDHRGNHPPRAITTSLRARYRDTLITPPRYGEYRESRNSVTEYRPDRSRSPSHICLCSRMLSPLTCLYETRVRS